MAETARLESLPQVVVDEAAKAQKVVAIARLDEQAAESEDGRASVIEAPKKAEEGPSFDIDDPVWLELKTRNQKESFTAFIAGVFEVEGKDDQYEYELKEKLEDKEILKIRNETRFPEEKLVVRE